MRQVCFKSPCLELTRNKNVVPHVMLPVWIQDIYVCVLASNHCPYANPELSLQGYFCRKAVMTNYKLFVLTYPYVLTFLICVTLAKCYRHYVCFCLEGQCLLAFVNGNLHSEQHLECVRN